MSGGGIVIDVWPIDLRVSGEVRRLLRVWVYDPRSGDESAVYVDPEQGAGIRVHDRVWWGADCVYWTRGGEFTDRQLPKVGLSFDPRPKT